MEFYSKLYFSEESATAEEPDDTVVLEVDSSTIASPPWLQSTSKTRHKGKSRQYWTHIHKRDKAPTIPIYDVCNYSDYEEDGIFLPIDLFRRFFLLMPSWI